MKRQTKRAEPPGAVPLGAARGAAGSGQGGAVTAPRRQGALCPALRGGRPWRPGWGERGLQQGRGRACRAGRAHPGVANKAQHKLHSCSRNHRTSRQRRGAGLQCSTKPQSGGEEMAGLGRSSPAPSHSRQREAPLGRKGAQGPGVSPEAPEQMKGPLFGESRC